MISRDLSAVTLNDLISILKLDFTTDIPTQLQELNWTGQLQENIQSINLAYKDSLSISLADLLTATKKDAALQISLDKKYADETNIDKKTYIKRVLTLIGLGSLGAAS